MRPAPLLAAFALAGLTLSAPGAELYGRPLRGLTPVSIAELHRQAPQFDGKTVRVKGEVRAEAESFALTEGAATLPVTMRDATPLPKDATGATATAEGTFRAKGPAGEPFLEATGLELTR